jgi:hypothetical protein
MKYTIAILFFISLGACNPKQTEQEEKEVSKVDSMVQNDEAKMDSMKKALGI